MRKFDTKGGDSRHIHAPVPKRLSIAVVKPATECRRHSHSYGEVRHMLHWRLAIGAECETGVSWWMADRIQT